MILGKNIFLRPVIKEDLTKLNEWKNDEETFKNLGGGFMPTSIDQQEKWIESIIDTQSNNKRFMICDRNNLPIGMAGLYGINWIHRTCEVGIYIGDRSAQGKGYGKESCKLIEKFAKEYLNIRKLKLHVVDSNKVATNLWDSLGYSKVGILKEERFIKGKYHDLMIMEKFI